MAVTPHGWHIQGSPKPAMYDEKALAIQCGGPSGDCKDCYQSYLTWRRDALRGSFYEDVQESIAKTEEPLETGRRSDAVVHPPHYNMYDGIEIIDLVEQMNFNKGNAVKYVTRAEFKGKEIEDLKKARYYLKKEIKRIKRAEKKAAKAKAQEEAMTAMANYAAADVSMSAQLYDVNSLYPEMRRKIHSDMVRQWHPSDEAFRSISLWVRNHNHMAYTLRAGNALIITAEIMNHNTQRFGVGDGNWIVKDGHGFSVYTKDEFKNLFEVM